MGRFSQANAEQKNKQIRSVISLRFSVAHFGMPLIKRSEGEPMSGAYLSEVSPLQSPEWAITSTFLGTKKQMLNQYELHAKLRESLGTSECRRLRRVGRVPGVLYGGGKAPTHISLSQATLQRHLEHEGFYSHILSVKRGDIEEKAILKDLQRHPSKPFILHLDLQRISEKEKIRVHVPLHFIGEESAPGIKLGGALSHHVIEVEVSCLPKDLPEFLEVDLSKLEQGGAVHLSEISLPGGVELGHGAEHDLPVASIHVTHEE